MNHPDVALWYWSAILLVLLATYHWGGGSE